MALCPKSVCSLQLCVPWPISPVIKQEFGHDQHQFKFDGSVFERVHAQR
jgi:hypothetical protein